jgi:secreted PhoX family phosphatase
MMFPGGQDRPTIAAGAVGASILNLQRNGARWEVVDGGFQSRRLTPSTLCAISGPAVPTLGEAVQGVLAPQSGCFTPWGTLLLAEADPLAWLARLPERFPKGAGAYGWVVEVDAFDPQAVPAKRTALARFARAGLLATTSTDGRAVVFMADDQPDGYLFRFVSDSRAEPGNPALLDSGTLSVAVAEGWSLRFAPLPKATATLTAARNAASALGAEPFDAPAGMALAPNGGLYLTCRGNAQRAALGSFHPRPSNPDGHVLLFRPDGRDPAATVFAGEITLLCGGGPAAGPTGWMSRPSSLALAADGAMWIGTDATGIAFAAPDMASVSRVYAPPVGALMGGAALTPDGAALLSAVRHPGATPGASFDRPATRWPSLRPDMPPQTTIVTLTRA